MKSLQNQLNQRVKMRQLMNNLTGNLQEDQKCLLSLFQDSGEETEEEGSNSPESRGRQEKRKADKNLDVSSKDSKKSK